MRNTRFWLEIYMKKIKLETAIYATYQYKILKNLMKQIIFLKIINT